ncbi:MAG: DUF1778 domain-containing protein, partial [Candidatus Nanopelagicales bacterium]|nr:DUF1778 domain-containing protein [Candidatus Nanopelagicales bacterium]
MTSPALACAAALVDELVRQGVSDFVLSQAVEAANEVLKTHDQHVLSTVDWETFCKALDRPP